MADQKQLNLSKKTVPELKELLDRQKVILRNRKLLENLKDKGENVKQLHDKIANEIEYRLNVETVQKSLSDLKITSNVQESKEKHVEYVCSKEKPIEDTRYRPHRTLVHNEIKNSNENSPKKPVDVTSAYEPYLIYKPTQCIKLSESLVIQQDQARKITEDKTKRFLQGFEDYNDTSESDDENVESTIALEDKD